MKNSIKIFTLFALPTILFACGIEQPIASHMPQNNDTYVVDYLFDHEGCKVYRFRDNGNYVYFTNCTGDVTSIKNDSTKTYIRTIVKSVEKK